MINVKDLYNSTFRCHSCKEDFHIKEKIIYTINVGLIKCGCYIPFKLNNHYTPASLSFCGDCWKSIAGEEYIFNLKQLDFL